MRERERPRESELRERDLERKRERGGRLESVIDMSCSFFDVSGSTLNRQETGSDASLSMHGGNRFITVIR